MVDGRWRHLLVSNQKERQEEVVVVAVDFMILAKLRYCSLNKFWLVRTGMRKTKTNKIKEVS